MEPSGQIWCRECEGCSKGAWTTSRTLVDQVKARKTGRTLRHRQSHQINARLNVFSKRSLTGRQARRRPTHNPRVRHRYYYPSSVNRYQQFNRYYLRAFFPSPPGQVEGEPQTCNGVANRLHKAHPVAPRQDPPNFHVDQSWKRKEEDNPYRFCHNTTPDRKKHHSWTDNPTQIRCSPIENAWNNKIQ